MRPRVRRRVHSPADLTSLLDVMFIIVFIALIRVAGPKPVAAEPAPLAPVPSRAPAPAHVLALRAQALETLREDLEGRTPLVVRVSAEGTITALEGNADKRVLDVPLLERSADPDAAIAYLGDRSAELRVCRIAVMQLGLADLAKHLVIIAPAVPLGDLRHALHRGLHEDLLHCLAEQRGIATIVDPANLPPARP